MNAALVFGAGGFVGKALGAYLAQNSSTRVRLAARRFSSPVLNAEHIVLPAHERALLPDDHDRLLDGIDTVYFLAAATPRILSKLTPTERQKALAGNAAMPLALAKASYLRGVKRFVFVSSCGVHGDHTQGQAITETSPYVAHDDYVTSKIKAEGALLESVGNIPALTIVRPPMVYGPGHQGAMKRLLDLAMHGVPLPLGSIIRNRRSMIGISNLVHFLRHAAAAPAGANQVFVVADSERPSTAELLRLAGRAAQRKPLLLPVPQSIMALGLGALGKQSKLRRLLEDYDVDDSKARRILGWSPPSTMLDEMKRIFAEPTLSNWKDQQ